jgi:hypothetical protein
MPLPPEPAPSLGYGIGTSERLSRPFVLKTLPLAHRGPVGQILASPRGIHSRWPARRPGPLPSAGPPGRASRSRSGHSARRVRSWPAHGEDVEARLRAEAKRARAVTGCTEDAVDPVEAGA